MPRSLPNAAALLLLALFVTLPSMPHAVGTRLLPRRRGVAADSAAPVDIIKTGDSVRYGLVELPPARHCSTKFNHICEAEYLGDLEGMYSKYEELMLECGLGFWVAFSEGTAAGRGLLRKSPCGSFVAVQVPRRRSPADGSGSVGHIARNCEMLKHVLPQLPACDGCFPRYYYYSNMTGVCYHENVDGVPLRTFVDKAAFLWHQDGDEAHEGNRLLPLIKTVLRQGLEAIALLQSAGIAHRNLGAENVVIRLRPGTADGVQATIVNFGWASMIDGVMDAVTARAVAGFIQPPGW